MNSYVERIELLPFSLWDELQINIPQVILLFITAACFGYWLMEKTRPGLHIGLIALFSFFFIRTISFEKANQSGKMIVYNVPKKQAIDIVDGRNYLLIGDADLLNDDFIRNFHIKPSRVKNRLKNKDSLDNLVNSGALILFNDRKVLLIDRTLYFLPLQEKISIDLLVISKNPKLYFKKNQGATIDQIVQRVLVFQSVLYSGRFDMKVSDKIIIQKISVTCK